MCNCLIDRIVFGGSCHFKSNVLFKLAPPKIQTFIWLVVPNQLCTSDFLLKCGLLLGKQSICQFCVVKRETSYHCYFIILVLGIVGKILTMMHPSYSRLFYLSLVFFSERYISDSGLEFPFIWHSRKCLAHKKLFDF